jgi:hypothetical protein
MLYREIIPVYPQIHTKHINALCGQNVEFVKVKPGGTVGFRTLKVQFVPTPLHFRCCICRLETDN